jgi:hypothetical protein
MALLGIVLVGLLIVAIILLGGHWVRRQGVQRRHVVPPDRQPLRRPPQPQADGAPNEEHNPAPATTDTVSDQANRGDTIA